MSHDIVAWHFLAEVPQPYGRAMRDCYALGHDRTEAAKALLSEHPRAGFRIDAGRPLTQLQLEKILGPKNGMVKGETVRCVQL